MVANIKLPFSDTPLLINIINQQLKDLYDGIVVNCARQCGKSTTLYIEISRIAKNPEEWVRRVYRERYVFKLTHGVK